MTNVQTLAYVLDEMNIDYKVISDKATDVFAKVNISKLAMALAKENCKVLSMQERDESLESYYVSLVVSVKIPQGIIIK